MYRSENQDIRIKLSPVFGLGCIEPYFTFYFFFFKSFLNPNVIFAKDESVIKVLMDNLSWAQPSTDFPGISVIACELNKMPVDWLIWCTTRQAELQLYSDECVQVVWWGTFLLCLAV